MNNEDFKVVLSDKEYIEKLEKEVHYQNKEVTRLNNIIKEVREYIEKERLYGSNGNNLSIADTGCGKKMLEILDKENI